MRALLAANIGYSPRHAGAKHGPGAPRRRRLRAAALLIGALALVFAGSTVVVLRALGHPLNCPRGRTCATHDAAADRPTIPRAVVLSSHGLGLNGPTGAAYAAGRMWVTNNAGNSVSEFGWRSGAHPSIQRGPMFAEPSAITSGRWHVWVANALANSVTELTAADGSVVRTISVAGAPTSLALYHGILWVANSAPDSVSEFNVKTGKLVQTIKGHSLDSPEALAISHGMLWIANAGSGTVTVLRASTGAWRATIDRHQLAVKDPMAEVASATMLWVAGANGIAEFSTIRIHMVLRIAGPRYGLQAPRAMVLARGDLWVANMRGNSVTEIDAATGRLVRVLAAPLYHFNHPAGIAAYHRRIWVTNSGDASVTVLDLPARHGAIHQGTPKP